MIVGNQVLPVDKGAQVPERSKIDPEAKSLERIIMVELVSKAPNRVRSNNPQQRQPEVSFTLNVIKKRTLGIRHESCCANPKVLYWVKRERRPATPLSPCSVHVQPKGR